MRCAVRRYLNSHESTSFVFEPGWECWGNEPHLGDPAQRRAPTVAWKGGPKATLDVLGAPCRAATRGRMETVVLRLEVGVVAKQLQVQCDTAQVNIEVPSNAQKPRTTRTLWCYGRELAT